MAFSGDTTDTANKIMISFGIDERSYKDITKEIKEDFQQLKEEVNSTSSAAGTSGAAFKALQIDLGEIGLATSELILSFSSLQTSLESFGEYKDVFVSWYDDMFGLAATAKATGQDITASFESVQEVASRGLLSEQESAALIKRFVDYGFSAQQAADMVNALTNSAIFLRKENFTLEQAVERATYGIASQQSVMAKSAGMSQTLTEIHERYAESIGLSAQEFNALDAATQHQIELQAEYQAFVEQGNKYQEEAAYYTTTAAGATIVLENAIQNAKAAVGSVIQYFAPLISGVAAWIQENKALVAGVMAAVTVILGATGLITAIGAAIKAFKLLTTVIAGAATISKAAVGGFVGLAVAIAAVGAAVLTTKSLTNSIGEAFEDLDFNTDALTESFEGLDAGVGSLTPSFGGATTAARDFSKELARLRRDYLEDLKQIEVRHQETVNKLTKQIQDANVDYRRAIDERNAEFQVSQAKEEKAHQEKVDELMTQIEFLRKYNNNYNRQKLADLEFALAEENAAYQKQTQAAKEELDLQNENDRLAYEEKRKQLQEELDDELAFMQKHRSDLNEVRDVILLDEIESLKRRYEEQKKSYEQQEAEATIAGGNIGANLGSSFSSSVNDLMEKLKKQWEGLNAPGGEVEEAGKKLGDTVGKSTRDSMLDWMDNTKDSLGQWYEQEFKPWWKRLWTKENWLEGITRTIKDTFTNPASFGINSSNGFATGGYTGQGAVDEIAGFVHRGEYVLPQEMVDQTTGTPKAMGNTYVINVNGTFATSAAERRRVADQIVQAINQNNKSRLEASWQ